SAIEIEKFRVFGIERFRSGRHIIGEPLLRIGIDRGASCGESGARGISRWRRWRRSNIDLLQAKFLIAHAAIERTRSDSNEQQENEKAKHGMTSPRRIFIRGYDDGWRGRRGWRTRKGDA